MGAVAGEGVAVALVARGGRREHGEFVGRRLPGLAAWKSGKWEGVPIAEGRGGANARGCYMLALVSRGELGTVGCRLVGDLGGERESL